MPDLNDDLFSSFKDEGAPMRPLPASEVRRRGNRMRRRNNTLATVGGVAAALVIATPFAVLAGQGPDRTAPGPAPAPPGARVDWPQQIPVGLPLSAGLVDGAEISDEPAVPQLSLCGQTVFDADEQTVDVAGVIRRGAPNSGEPELTRTLALYPDATTAAEAVARIRDAVGTCPSEAGPGNHTVHHELIASDLRADDAFLLADRYVPAGEDYPDGIDYYVVARTGNAVLVTADPGTPPNDEQVAFEQERAADLVDAMLVFSEAENTAADPRAQLADDFPLDAGMAPDGATTAATVTSDLSGDGLSSLVPCRREAWGYQDDTVVDVRGAAWSDGETGGEFRTVATYGSGQAAAAFARISDAVADCDRVTPVDLTAGDEALAFVNGDPTTFVVVRVGDALLLIRSFDADAADLVSRAAPVLEALAER